MSDPPVTVDSYLAGQSDAHRRLLERVRALIRDTVPEATEAIAYGMPGFRLDGRLLLSYAGYRHHCAVYPASESVKAALGDELAPFLAAKATIRFTADDPLPEGLLRRIAGIRAGEVADG